MTIDSTVAERVPTPYVREQETYLDTTPEEIVINLVFDAISAMRGDMSKLIAIRVRELLTDYINGQDITHKMV